MRPWVLAALRARRDGRALEPLATAAADGRVDWSDWLGCTSAELVAPLVHAALRDAAWLPVPVAAALRRAYIENAARNTLLLRELGRVLDLLADHDLPVIVLKGAALAETVYGNPALRPMADIDLLLRRPDVLRGLAVLERAGYGLARPEMAPAAALDYDNEIALLGPGPLAAPLEIHWSLLDTPHYQARLPMDWFWATSRPARVAQRPARVLGSEGLLLHLCAHLALHHGGRGLLWQNDVAELLAQAATDIDWPDLVARAAAWDLVLATRDVLAGVAADWGAPVPRESLADLADMRVSPAEAAVWQRLRTADRSATRRLLDDLAEMPGWAARLRFAGRNVWPSPAYMRERYGLRHPALVVAAYPYRWWRGLRGLIGRE